MKTVYKASVAGFPIEMVQLANRRFRVIYGKQIRTGLDYAQAAAELGSCIMHALACEGKLDNEGP